MPLPQGRRLYGPYGFSSYARAHGSAVIWVCDTHPPGDRESTTSVPASPEWGAQIVDALQPPDDEYRVHKRRYSGFYGLTWTAPARAWSRARDPDRRGPNICVRSTRTTPSPGATSDRCAGLRAPPASASRNSLYDTDTHFARSPTRGVLAVFARAGPRVTRARFARKSGGAARQLCDLGMEGST